MVARLRAERLARARKPFLARGGSRRPRCGGCRLVESHCICALRRSLATRAGVCLLMHDAEPLKPSNTGWLVADVVTDTFAFGWARTEVAPALLVLLADPRWQPVLVFPAQYAPAARVWQALPPAELPGAPDAPRPLLVLLDGTWSEARKMFHHSPYLAALPVLDLAGVDSAYPLRRSTQAGHLCTAEVVAQCLALAGDERAAALLQAWLRLYIERYVRAREQRPVLPGSAAEAALVQAGRE